MRQLARLPAGHLVADFLYQHGRVLHVGRQGTHPLRHGARQPHIVLGNGPQQGGHGADLDGIVHQPTLAVLCAEGHEPPHTGHHGLLHAHFQLAIGLAHQGAGLALAHDLVDQRQVGSGHGVQRHLAAGAAFSRAVQQRQHLGQRGAGGIAPGQLFGLGQHGWAVGVHVFGHGQVVQRLVFKLCAGADGHHGNGKVFHGVCPFAGALCARCAVVGVCGLQWQPLPGAALCWLTTGMPMVGGRDGGRLSAAATPCRYTSQSCMPAMAVTYCPSRKNSSVGQRCEP